MAPPVPSFLLSRRDLDFLLYDWLDAEGLTARPRFAEHSRETFAAAMDLSQTIAERHFAPHYRRNDVEEPQFRDGRVVIHEEVGQALAVLRDSGLIAAGMPADVGGMQLPATVTTAVFAWLQAANVHTSAYPFLTIANANLLLAHGSPEQVDRYVLPMLEGRFTGTMCLSEPQAGSSLADVAVRAAPQADGSYRLFGNKMWISGGDHELSETIVHLVLARIPGSPPGVKGLSLFVVPKHVVGPDGSAGERNDVTLAGLNHKMGYRGTTNCLLNFGEGTCQPGGRAGAVGEIVGAPGQGLAQMFHMMNEARIGVGVGAVALGYSGYLLALEYARNRPQGRPLRDRDPVSPQIPITGHADVRRMLLAMKSYVEGGMALCLYSARLVDDSVSHPDAGAAADAAALLDLLTPITKSWPSQWCLEANSVAIQVHGGYGYTRDYLVELLYRDNRLNPIHEGTHGIQALDLLGRRAIQRDGAGLRVLLGRMADTCARAAGAGGEDADHAAALDRAAQRVAATTAAVWRTGDPELALANATAYLEAVGHVVVAWLWLEQVLALAGADDTFARGKRAAARYFFHVELARTGPMFDLLDALDRTTLDADPDTF